MTRMLHRFPLSFWIGQSLQCATHSGEKIKTRYEEDKQQHRSREKIHYLPSVCNKIIFKIRMKTKYRFILRSIIMWEGDCQGKFSWTCFIIWIDILLSNTDVLPSVEWMFCFLIKYNVYLFCTTCTRLTYVTYVT